VESSQVRLRIRPRAPETRSHQQLLEHYEIERKLAARLRTASKEERRKLYTAVYDEMFRQVPHHPMLQASAGLAHPGEAGNLRFLSRFLTPDSVFLEIGPGDCRFACTVAPLVKRVYAVDVSEQLTKDVVPPPNFHLLISDGTSIPVPHGSIDIAYSNQVMEHLHPDDAEEQLTNIYRSLAPGGRYVCVTPNRIYGPTDMSQYFDAVATCFHLKEYSVGEIRALLGRAGFHDLKFYVGARGVYFRAPGMPIRGFERLLEKLPYPFRKTVADRKPLRALLGIRVVAGKPLTPR
jgi:SAM-dependent methyltransferase